MSDDQPDGLCAVCNERPAATWWSDSVLAFAHRFRQPICQRCVLRRQLVHARELAAEIPGIVQQLLEADPNGVPDACPHKAVGPCGSLSVTCGVLACPHLGTGTGEGSEAK
ncbi:MAG: hypothetical protein A2W26_02305 [Acidobacteria bacterium RBG_16_64_8]|nr:MAG: hypothetical protein A2W26_02305 [Acidobacteria bacterium RBG_16_64_8]